MKKESSENDGCNTLVLEITIAIGLVIMSCLMSKKGKESDETL